MKPLLNKAQIILREIYDNGEFKNIKSVEETKDCGDGLFTFLMYELADSEDCYNLVTAINRVETAIAQLQTVKANLDEAYFA